jgi:hypothetical protein
LLPPLLLAPLLFAALEPRVLLLLLDAVPPLFAVLLLAVLLLAVLLLAVLPAAGLAALRAVLPLFAVLLLAVLRVPLEAAPDLAAVPPLRAVLARVPPALPRAAPFSGALRRLVLRCSFSPRPALKPTVVRSGILISEPVRGLRPLRAARVRRVNLPKPGIDSEPAAWTASEIAPEAVSKIASTTRAAAALVSSALSATMSMNSDLFMIPLSGCAVYAARPIRADEV